MEWDLKPSFNTTITNNKDSTFHIMFRTRSTDGVIWQAQSFSTLERYRLEIVESRLRFLYDLGSGDRILTLPYVDVADGLWHTVNIERYGTNGVLRLDRGEGKYYAELDFADQHRWISLSGMEVFAAADVRYNPFSHTPYINDDLLSSESP